MSDLALYRKYRPKEFSDVRGQDEIVTTLVRSIKDKSVTHAYLFSGGRGTGKTTVARIFAAEIGTKPADLYEIDGASNRTIDDVRELRVAAVDLDHDRQVENGGVGSDGGLEGFEKLTSVHADVTLQPVCLLSATEAGGTWGVSGGQRRA
jgi:DNA polymerase III delta prime subunit